MTYVDAGTASGARIERSATGLSPGQATSPASVPPPAVSSGYQQADSFSEAAQPQARPDGKNESWPRKILNWITTSLHPAPKDNVVLARKGIANGARKWVAAELLQALRNQSAAEEELDRVGVQITKETGGYHIVRDMSKANRVRLNDAIKKTEQAIQATSDVRNRLAEAHKELGPQQSADRSAH